MNLSQIWTIGTSNRSQEKFIQILKRFGIRLVLDVRRFPRSNRFPWFNKIALQKCLAFYDIEYAWLGEKLGGYRKEGYEQYTKTHDFNQGLKTLMVLSKCYPSCITCAELLPWRCHRIFIGKALEQLGWDVFHIIDESRVWKIKNQMKSKENFVDSIY